MRKPCPHGVILPRGLKCQAGYLIIRLFTETGKFNQGCGPHTPAMEKGARLALQEIRVKQQFGTFNLPTKAVRVKFKDAAAEFFRLHYRLWKDPETHEPRGQQSINSAASMLKALTAFFGDFYLDAIKTPAVKAYKVQRIEFDDVSNATFNREKGVLSAVFNMYAEWIAGEEIEPVKLPAENPCIHVTDLRETARTRVASLEEIKRLKDACRTIGDPVMLQIIMAELETLARAGDLLKLLGNESNTLRFTQGKTGRQIALPGSSYLKNLGGMMDSYRTLNYRWNKIREVAGLDDLQFRDLRRTGAKLLEKSDATRRVIKNALGHTNENTTEIYLPSDPDELRESRLKVHAVLESL